MRRLFVGVSLALAAGHAIVAQPAAPNAAADGPLPGLSALTLPYRADSIARACSKIVTFMDQFWRLAGNPGFNTSIDHIRARLLAAGSAARKSQRSSASTSWAKRQRMGLQVGTVTFADGGDGDRCLRAERDRVSLCINSFSTPRRRRRRRSSTSAPARRADYEGKDVKGAVVLGDADVGQLWQQAVKTRGAIGVISTTIAPYIRPADPAQFTSPDQRDVFQWGSDAVRRGREGVRIQGQPARRREACATG